MDSPKQVDQLALLKAGRHPCPSCERRGLRYARHPGDHSVQVLSKAVCRFCLKRFTIRSKVDAAAT